MKRLLLVLSIMVFAVCLFTITTSAIMVDGIDYSLKNGEATVTTVNQGCTLTVVNIPETITVTAEHTDDASLHGTYTVAYIAEWAFHKNSSVEEVTTPATLKSIGAHSFREMGALKTVVLRASESFKSFHDAEFWNNKQLVSIDMSGCVGLTGIGDGGNYDDTFDGCVNLERVVFPKGITYIGRQTFFNCSKLTTIENLDFTQITYVGYKAFWGPKLSGDVILSENATYVGSHAFRETNITSLVMRAGSTATQTTMDDATFYNCRNLKYVVLPDNIEVIGQYTFSGCSSLEYLVLGGNITSFSTTSTFNGCGALKAIIYQGSQESFEALPGISALGTLEYKDFSEYVHGTLPSKRTVYYNATTCGKCNGILGEKGFIFTDLLTEMKNGQRCIHCENENVTEKYAPVFVDLGYSTFELNGKCSIMQAFKIDYDSVKIYNENVTGDDIGAFGVLAVAGRRVEDVAFDENGVALAGVLSYEVKAGHNYFEIKITNIPANEMLDEETYYADAKFHLCAYANVGDEIYYISEDHAGTVLGTAVSYNDIK